MKNLIDSFAKYTGKDSLMLSREAMQDIQSDIIDELIAEIETCGLVKHDSPLDIQFELENLREWLNLYYHLEKK